MGKRLAAVCLALTFLLGSRATFALDKTQVWDLYREGESAFRQGTELFDTDPLKARELLEKAAVSFETVQREGDIENGNLFYNLGNTYFRLADLGKAILNYRKAERFIPDDINLQQNLNYARTRCADKIEPMPQTQAFRTVFFWHYDLSGSVRAWLFALFFAMLWCFASLYLLLKRSWLRHVVLCCAVVSLSLGCSIAVQAYHQSRIVSGVVLENAVVGRKGDSTTFEPTFKDPLHAGTEFSLVEERNGWLHIELADGRRCWIPKTAAGIV